MDIKITGITEEIMKTALWQARDGRLHILGKMSEALEGARPGLGEYAPRIEVITIPTDKIREVIGTGGKVIREIVEKTGAKIDISDDGTVKIASSSGAAIDAALKWIKSIVSEPEVGEIYDGKVVKVVDFGAFVNFFGARDGLVHVSELAPARCEGVRRRQRGRRREGEAPRLRQPRQGAPVDEAGGPADGRGHLEEAGLPKNPWRTRARRRASDSPLNE